MYSVDDMAEVTRTEACCKKWHNVVTVETKRDQSSTYVGVSKAD